MAAIPPMPFHLLSPFLRAQCFCGVDSDDPTELGAAMCTTDCAGDSSQTCGGRNAISVYAYDTVPTLPQYLGCWQDSRRNRIMDVVQSDSSMTNDVSRGFLKAKHREATHGTFSLILAEFVTIHKNGNNAR